MWCDRPQKTHRLLWGVSQQPPCHNLAVGHPVQWLHCWGKGYVLKGKSSDCFLTPANWSHNTFMAFYCSVCYQLLKATSSGICLPQTAFLHSLCRGFRWPGKPLLPKPHLGALAWLVTLFPVSRTPETHSAVFLGAFSPSAKKSLVDVFPHHQRASTSSNCLTTARRASCVTSCAMLLAWTRASSYLNSSSSGQATQEGCVGLPKTRLWGSVYVEPARSVALNYRRVMKDSLTLLFKLGWADYSSLPHTEGWSFCSTIQFFASPFAISTTQCLMTLSKYDYTAARCFSGLTVILDPILPILSKLKSNTDALQAIRHEVSWSETEQCIDNMLYTLGFHYPDNFQPLLDES